MSKGRMRARVAGFFIGYVAGFALLVQALGGSGLSDFSGLLVAIVGPALTGALGYFLVRALAPDGGS